MSSVLTDIIQSLTIGMLAITLLFLTRRVNRLPHQTATQHITFDYKEPEAVCGCTHHHCFHDDNGCGYSQQVYEFNSTRSPLGDMHCGCKRYTGPEPLPQVIP